MDEVGPRAVLTPLHGKVWVGLNWGLSSGADYCNILIRPNGQFALAVMDQGEYRRILDWREASSLEKKSNWNTVRIERRATGLQFLGQRFKNMSSYSTRFWLNGKVGFRINGGSKAEFDYLTVTRP